MRFAWKLWCVILPVVTVHRVVMWRGCRSVCVRRGLVRHIVHGKVPSLRARHLRRRAHWVRHRTLVAACCVCFATPLPDLRCPHLTRMGACVIRCRVQCACEAGWDGDLCSKCEWSATPPLRRVVQYPAAPHVPHAHSTSLLPVHTAEPVSRQSRALRPCVRVHVVRSAGRRVGCTPHSRTLTRVRALTCVRAADRFSPACPHNAECKSGFSGGGCVCAPGWRKTGDGQPCDLCATGYYGVSCVKVRSVTRGCVYTVMWT